MLRIYRADKCLHSIFSLIVGSTDNCNICTTTIDLQSAQYIFCISDIKDCSYSELTISADYLKQQDVK